jgi:hypothetical protein
MPKQTEIPGTEIETVPIIDEALHALFAGKQAAKLASSNVTLLRDVLHMHMADHQKMAVPYLDDKGKRRLYKLDAKLVGKSINAPRGGGGTKPKADRPGEEVESKKAQKKADKEAAEVEHKKRSRTSVKAELAERDANLAERDAAADPIGQAAAEATAANDDAWQPSSSNPYAEDGDDATSAPTPFDEPDPSEAGRALVGKRVKFNHQREAPETHLVITAGEDGLVELEGWEGRFAAHLFAVEQDAIADAIGPDEDVRPPFLREKTAARAGSILEEAEQRQKAAASGEPMPPIDVKDKATKSDPIDRDTRAAGKCGLIHKDSGSICVTLIGADGKHNGLHTNASGWKWKARMPKEGQ